MDDKIKSLFRSRRFWLAVGGLIFVGLHETGLDGGLTEETVQQVVLVAVGWIVGDSIRETE